MKNNKHVKLRLGYALFGLLGGLWLAIFLVEYLDVFYLWVAGGLGASLCVAGFVRSWIKYNDISNVYNRSVDKELKQCRKERVDK